MSWDESLFGFIFDQIKHRKAKREAARTPFNVKLIDLSPRLTVLCSAIAQTPIQIHPTRNGLGLTRLRSLVLPNEINIFNSKRLNEELYLCRAAFSCLAIREVQKKTISILISKDNWREHCEKIITSEFPGLHNRLKALDLAALPLSNLKDWEGWSRGNFPVEEHFLQVEDLPVPLTLDPTSNKNQQVLINNQPALATVRELETDDINPAVHVFEKALTADDYQGGKRNIDSDGDSNEPGDALSELNMDQVVRATGETGSTYSGGLHLDEIDTQSSQSQFEPTQAKIFQYPEWSKRKRKLLPNWCRVYEESIQPPFLTAPHLNQNKIKKESEKLKKSLSMIANRSVWRPRQEEGTELDLESFVRLKAEIHSGHAKIEKLYLNRIRTELDISIFILADTSLSTDSWVNSKRVLDTIQESLLILSETLSAFPSQVSISAFFSNTRNQCSFLLLKDFGESWKDITKKIASLKPQGYTRIGPAIRHATYRLDSIQSKRKILLIISDSKPTDYDAYEGTHGEADVHHAIQEAKAKKITVKGLAVSIANQGHVKRIYGRGGYETFVDSTELASKIVKVYLETIQ